MNRYLVTYAGTFVAMAVLDSVWLGLIARGWYRDGMGDLMAVSPNWAAAAAFYVLYPVGMVIFAVLPANGDWLRALTLGALFGLFCYGTYDLTNMAVVRNWPIGLSLMDLAWGGVVSAASVLAGTWALRWASA